MRKFSLSIRFVRPTFFQKASKRGMTLTEMIIAGGIGVLLIGSAIFFGMRFQQGASLESAKADLNEKMQVLSRQFSMDLSNAIRVKGHPNFEAAVYRVSYDGPAAEERDENNFDHIRMYVIHAKEFSVPISISGPSAEAEGEEQGIFSAEFSAGGSDEDLNRSSRFLEAALNSADVFLVSNSRSSFLIDKVGNSVSNGSETGNVTFDFKIRLRNGDTPPNIDYSSARIQAVKMIEYQVIIDDEAAPLDGRLERTVSHFTVASESPVLRHQTVLKNLKQFHVNWFLADRRNELFGGSEGEALQIPGDPVSVPSDPWLWTDISAAQLVLELESEKSFSRGVSGASSVYSNPDPVPLADAMCRWASEDSPSKLICRGIEVASATDFEDLLIGSDRATVGAVDCLPQDFQNRCKPGCQASFTSAIQSDLNWSGYASGSDWCQCVNNAKISPGQFIWGSHSGNFPSLEEDQNDPDHRYNACVRDRLANTTCAQVPQNSDPRLRFVCQGMVNSVVFGVDFRSSYLDVNRVGLSWPPQQGQEQERYQAWANLRAALLAVKNQTAPFDSTRGGSPPHFNPWMPTDSTHQEAIKKVSCRAPHDSTRQNALKDWLGNGAQQILPKYCGCLIYQLHPETMKPWWVDTSFPPVGFNNARWARWSDPNLCPNFYLQPPDDDSDSAKIIFKSSYLGTANNCNEATGQTLYRFMPDNCCTGNEGAWNGPGCDNTHFSNDAAYVQCIREHGGNDPNFSNYRLPISESNPRPPNYEVVLTGWPNVNNPGLTEGSSKAQTVGPIKYREGNGATEEMQNLRSCARLDCDFRGENRLSCCVAENRRLVGQSLTNFLLNLTPTTRTRPSDGWSSNLNFDHTLSENGAPTPPSGEDAITNKGDWSGYCYQGCPHNSREGHYFTHRGWRAGDGAGARIDDPLFDVNNQPTCSTTSNNHFRVPWCASRTRVWACPPSNPPNCNSQNNCPISCGCTPTCCNNCASNSAHPTCCEGVPANCCTPGLGCGATIGE